jgi:hypothetical protein
LGHIQNTGSNLAVDRALRIDPEGLGRQQINFRCMRFQRFKAGGIIDVIKEAQGLSRKQIRSQVG